MGCEEDGGEAITGTSDTPDMSNLRHHLLPKAPHIPDYRHQTVRPIWRGRLHAVAVVVFAPLLAWLLVITPASSRLTVAIYAASLLACLTVSAAYHLLARSPAAQTVMQRIDRATIYVLIAGTYTPIIPLITEPPATYWLLGIVWVGAVTGVVFRSLGILNKTSTGLYLAVGWVAVFTAPALWSASMVAFVLVLIGGVAFTVGAVIYATKRPVLSTTHFGHHELFHALTLVGMLTQFAAIWVLVTTVA